MLTELGTRFHISTSTSTYLFRPQEAFEHAHKLNSDPQIAEHLGKNKATVLLYPFYPTVASFVSKVAQHAGVYLPVPGAVTISDVERWQNRYNVEVSGIHFPFSYNFKEAIIRPFVESGRGIMQRMMLLTYLFTFEPANNRYAQRMAQELTKSKNRLEITLHSNVAAGYLRRPGNMERKKRQFEVFVEPAVYFPSPILKGPALWDPSATASEIASRHNLGFVLNVDHLSKSGIKKALDNPEVLATTRAIHMAAVGKNRIDKISTPQDLKSRIEEIKGVKFQSRNIRVVFEGTPFNQPKFEHSKSNALLLLS